MILPGSPLKTDPALIEHLDASLQVIGLNTGAHYSGLLHTYRPIASELRKLACDYQQGKDISLFPRRFPGMTLHPLVGSPDMIDEHTTLYIPCSMHFDGKGGSDIDFLFDETKDPMNIAEWLEQPLFRQDVTVKKLIRSVADKEAAHADEDKNSTLHLTRSVLFPGNDSLAAKAVVAIGRYLVKVIALQSLQATGHLKWLLAKASNEPQRGVIDLSLKTFCQTGIHNFTVKFVERGDVNQDQATEQQKNELIQLLDNYDQKTEILLRVFDLNDRSGTIYRLMPQQDAV
jgi:hypothetical protein